MHANPYHSPRPIFLDYIASLFELFAEYLMHVAEKTLTTCEVILTFLVAVVIERRKQRFMDRLISRVHFDSVMTSTTYFTVLSVLSKWCVFLCVFLCI